MAVSVDHTLTEYELQRLAHVQRNREYMARLGVVQLGSTIAGSSSGPGKGQKSKSTAVRVKREPVQGTRRSARVKHVAPEHDGTSIDKMGDDEGLTVGGKRKQRSADDDGPNNIAAGPAGLNRNVWSSEAYALAASRAWLEDARCIMLSRSASSSSHVATTNHKNENKSEWRDEAVSRWGRGVPDVHAVADWEKWTLSRIGDPPPPSDMQLLQEYYAHDAWQLLVACVLMARVSSWAVKHDTIAKFFQKYPTPTSALAAKPDDALSILRPLGLFPNRFRSVIEVSTTVLTDVKELDVGMEHGVNKIHGVGEFGVDSFHVFARGDLECAPADKTLQAFVAWQKIHRESSDNGTGKGK
jgi:methyl-CpG-binding domain protein 4